jgi:outer membrane biosynthesis protein TonB
MKLHNGSWIAPLVLGFFVLSIPTQGWAEEKPAVVPPAEKQATKVDAKSSVPVPATAGAGSYVEDFLDYRVDIQSRVEGIWAEYLAQYGKQLKRGRAVFTYHVNPDGKVTLVESVVSAKYPAISALAHRTILEANKKMEPFPSSVKAKHPSGYFNQIAFAVK